MGGDIHLRFPVAFLVQLIASLDRWVSNPSWYRVSCQKDIIAGGPFKYRNGAIALPKGPGLGVELAREKLGLYAEHFRQHGGYAYDRDPTRPDWYSMFPEANFANPKDGAMEL